MLTAVLMLELLSGSPYRFNPETLFLQACCTSPLSASGVPFAPAEVSELSATKVKTLSDEAVAWVGKLVTIQ